MQKLRIVMKDPDGVLDSLSDAGLDYNDLPSDVETAVRKYFQYQEYVTIDINLQEGTAEVVPYE